MLGSKQALKIIIYLRLVRVKIYKQYSVFLLTQDVKLLEAICYDSITMLHNKKLCFCLPVFEGHQFLSGQDYNPVHAFSDQPARDTPKQIHM